MKTTSRLRFQLFDSILLGIIISLLLSSCSKEEIQPASSGTTTTAETAGKQKSSLLSDARMNLASEEQKASSIAVSSIKGPITDLHLFFTLSKTGTRAGAQYNVHVFDNGLVTFHGLRNCPVADMEFSIGTEKLNFLKESFENAKFSDLPASFEGNPDFPTTIITLQICSLKECHLKSVKDQASNLPEALTGLQANIEKALDLEANVFSPAE